MTYTLYYAPDNASLVIRLIMTELDVPFETSLVDRVRQDQTSAEYLRVNPHGMIPTLVTPDGPIFETAAIALLLSDRHAGLAPQPNDIDRARYLKWLFSLSNTLHASLRLLFYPEKLVGPDSKACLEVRTGTQSTIVRYLDTLNDACALGELSFTGCDVSVLDYYICVMLRWLALYPVGHSDWFDLSAYPALKQLAQITEHRSAVHTAQAAEGLGPTPFSHPSYATPPEGTAL